MTKTAHYIYLGLMTLIVIVVLVAIGYEGYGYYHTSLEERYFHEGHNAFKSSGVIGHGLGIFGTLAMVIGVSTYMLRKRYRVFSRMGLLKYWLEFHIFLCTLGPILVLYHTSFKFGGIVAISFWSMVAVFASGVVGRFIYLQIPRSIEGRELSLNEVRGLQADIGALLRETVKLDDESYNSIVSATEMKRETKAKGVSGFFSSYFDDRRSLHNVKRVLKKNNIPGPQLRKILALVKGELSLNRRIGRLQTMQNLFKYWHVAHLPFALVMLVIMVIHVVVTIVFGFKWIF
ncbi:MAG: hypothetical protein KKD74_05990 [Bacteroidetes bacterium]|nr:hypothetical protein [Bacteroidota bacterium]